MTFQQMLKEARRHPKRRQVAVTMLLLWIAFLAWALWPTQKEEVSVLLGPSQLFSNETDKYTLACKKVLSKQELEPGHVVYTIEDPRTSTLCPNAVMETHFYDGKLKRVEGRGSGPFIRVKLAVSTLHDLIGTLPYKNAIQMGDTTNPADIQEGGSGHWAWEADVLRDGVVVQTVEAEYALGGGLGRYYWKAEVKEPCK